MRENHPIGFHSASLALATAACLLPWDWIAFPAAAWLVLWLPGRFLVACLPSIASMPGRVWMALATSFVFMPILLDWTWRWTREGPIVLAVVVLLDLVLLWIARRRFLREDAPPMFAGGGPRLLFAGMVLAISVCVFASFWLPHAAGRVGVTGAHDYTKHHAVGLTLEQHPLPLHNVFSATESNAGYFYYHYYYLLPAALRAITGNTVSIALAFGLTSGLLAACFIALTCLLARELLGSTGGALLAAACVSVVGGWDIAAVLIRVLNGAPMVITLDSWCPVAWRIHNLSTQYVWCPQHVCAVLGLLLAALWLHRAPRARWWLVIGPLIGASIFGCSTYLAIAIFAAAVCYAVSRVLAAPPPGTSRLRIVGAFLVIAVLGAALMAWQAWGYARMSERFEGGLTAHWDRFPLSVLGGALPPGPAANFLDVPWIMLVDFGLGGVACLLVAGRVWRVLLGDPGMRLVLLAGVVGIFLMFTVRSTINPIDYAFRLGIMPALAATAIVAGALWEPENVRASVRRGRKAVLIIGIVLGLPVGLWEMPLAAGRSLLEKRSFISDAGAIRYLREEAPKDAVIQGSPLDRVELAQLVDRQMGIVNPDNPHVRVFWPPFPHRLYAAVEMADQAFQTDSPEKAAELLAGLGVTHVLVGAVERQRYGEMPQFDDPEYFEVAYRDADATVYRLKPRPDVRDLIGGRCPLSSG